MNKDLLTPRYIVTGPDVNELPYPNSPFRVGDVIEMTHKETHINAITGQPSEAWVSDFIEYEGGRTKYSEYYFAPYPHIFRPLKWHENRNVEDMPEYVGLKLRDGTFTYIHKVEEWAGVNINNIPLYKFYNKVGYLSTACILEMLPATEAEYLKFKKEK